MTLKTKKLLTESEVSSELDQWSGPWGRINPTPGAATVVRFRLLESERIRKTYSFPYRTISWWCWTEQAAQEEIKIQAGNFPITLRGKMLGRIAEALDGGALELVSGILTGMSQDPTTIQIKSVAIESGSTLSRD